MAAENRKSLSEENYAPETGNQLTEKEGGSSTRVLFRIIIFHFCGAKLHSALSRGPSQSVSMGFDSLSVRMAVPTYDEFFLPLLSLLVERNQVSFGEAKDLLAERMGISDEDRDQLLPSGRQSRYDNRVG